MVKSAHVSSDNLTTTKVSTPSLDKQRGASLVEYSLLVALIAAITIGGVKTLGEHARDQFAAINQELE